MSFLTLNEFKEIKPEHIRVRAHDTKQGRYLVEFQRQDNGTWCKLRVALHIRDLRSIEVNRREMITDSNQMLEFLIIKVFYIVKAVTPCAEPMLHVAYKTFAERDTPYTYDTRIRTRVLLDGTQLIEPKIRDITTYFNFGVGLVVNLSRVQTRAQSYASLMPAVDIMELVTRYPKPCYQSDEAVTYLRTMRKKH